MNKTNNRLLLVFIVLIAIPIIIILFIMNRTSNTTTEYDKDLAYIELEYSTKQIALNMEKLLNLLEKDDTILSHEDMYIDFVIYGDEVYGVSNDLEGKIRYTGLIIGETNYNKDKLSISGNKLAAKKLLKKTNNLIKETNNKIETYNRINKTHLTHISLIEKEVIE